MLFDDVSGKTRWITRKQQIYKLTACYFHLGETCTRIRLHEQMLSSLRNKLDRSEEQWHQCEYLSMATVKQ